MNIDELIDRLFPPFDSEQLDVELRIALVIGGMGSGKTTLTQTIANKIIKRYKNEAAILYGFWLHKLIPRAIQAGIVESKKYILVVQEDATGFLTRYQNKKLLTQDMFYFFRIRHNFKDHIKKYTGKIALIINAHSYMLLEKHVKHAHMIIVKSLPPKWQRFEHEDITFRFLDSILIRELTKMRYSTSVDDVLSALNKAIVVNMDGKTEVLKYNAIKGWPNRNFFECLDPGIDMNIEIGSKVPVPRPPIQYKKYLKIMRDSGIRSRDTKLHEAYVKLMKEMGFSRPSWNGGDIDVVDE